uniref:Polyprotein protein n=1 Tax=Solanum tuberosum TaxID=4113 RepID=M1B5N6_SOLTU
MWTSLIMTEIDVLRVDVDQLRSTDISMLWGEVPLPDAPKSMPTSMPSGELPQSVDEQLSEDDILVDDSIERDADKADDNLAKKTNKEELWREEDEQRIADSTIPPINVSGTDALFEPPVIIFSSIDAHECHSS